MHTHSRTSWPRSQFAVLVLLGVLVLIATERQPQRLLSPCWAAIPVAPHPSCSCTIASPKRGECSHSCAPRLQGSPYTCRAGSAGCGLFCVQ
jgi:hypothetical protein